jgi:hypothetical protein
MDSPSESIHVRDLISSWDRLKRFSYENREIAFEEWGAEVALEKWDAVLFQEIEFHSIDPLKKRVTQA